MATKAFAASAGDRFSRYLHSLDFSSPFVTSGALAIFKRYGPVGLIAATVGGYALKRHLSKPSRGHNGAASEATPKTKGKKAKTKHKK